MVRRIGYGPWQSNLHPAERRARLRAIRALVSIATKADHPALAALEFAERDETEESLVKAFVAFNRLPMALRKAVTDHLAWMTAIAERRLN